MSGLVVVRLPESDQTHDHIMCLSTFTSDITSKIISASRCWILGSNFIKPYCLLHRTWRSLLHIRYQKHAYIYSSTHLLWRIRWNKTLVGYLTYTYCNVIHSIYSIGTASVMFHLPTTSVQWHRLSMANIILVILSTQLNHNKTIGKPF